MYSLNFFLLNVTLTHLYIALLLTEELSERNNTTTEQNIELGRLKEQVLALKRELEIAGQFHKRCNVIKNVMINLEMSFLGKEAMSQ